MKKIMLSIFTVLLLSLTLISAATPDLSINPITSVSGKPGDTIDISVNVKNNGGSTILSVKVESTDLTFGSNIINAPASTAITNLAAGQTKAATLSLRLPTKPAGGYIGTIRVSDASDTTNPVVTAPYIVTINAIDGINVKQTNVAITSQEDQVRNASFEIENTGSTSYTPTFSFDPSKFSDKDRDITITFSGAGTEAIKPGETKIVTITADIPNKIDIDTYSGTITVKGGSATDTFNLEVSVRPEVCKDGPVGDLAIDINEPDNGDNFAPGEIINIDVDVDNDGDDRLDVIVEAFLYNVDANDEVERVESESTRIDDSDSENFEFDLEIPFNGDITEEDSYSLFIKAYEDGDEDKNCAENEIDIDIERETHDVRIEKINLIPSSVNAGDLVDIVVDFINVGSKDEDDVTVRLNVPEFGWDFTSSPVNLDDGEGKDNDGAARFTGLRVPRNIAPNSYSVLASVFFDDGAEQKDEFATLTVLEGGPKQPETSADALKTQSVSDTGNNAFSISLVVSNDNEETKTYDLEVTAGWAELVATHTFSVASGDNKIVQVLVQAKEGTETGSYSGIVTLRDAGTIVDTETFTVAVSSKEAPPAITGFTIGDIFSGTSGTALFVILDIVLIIIAIFFIRLIFKSGNRKKMPKVVEKVKL